MVQKNSVIIIAGPTASGKSSVAFELAKTLNGEIICADSMQIYKDMDIGTAKASKDEQNKIKHHMLDIITPQETFSVAHYEEMATKIIQECLNSNKTPIICGGTGQYISALIEGIKFIDVKTDLELRKTLENEYEQIGKEAFFDKVNKLDPETAKKLHPNDKKRLVRAIEVYKLTDKTITMINETSKINGPKFQFDSFCLFHHRDNLYERINNRVNVMIDMGLKEEVINLKEKYPDISKTARQAIGYKEYFSYLNGEISNEQAIDKIKQNSRNYAKRQLTWFRKVQDIIWIINENPSKTVNLIKEHYNN